MRLCEEPVSILNESARIYTYQNKGLLKSLVRQELRQLVECGVGGVGGDSTPPPPTQNNSFAALEGGGACIHPSCDAEQPFCVANKALDKNL